MHVLSVFFCFLLLNICLAVNFAVKQFEFLAVEDF